MKIKTNQGFSLIEVLIAFVILVVGLLGATTLIIRSSQVNVNAYETEQIAMLANTMVRKIRANPDGIDTYIALDRPASGQATVNCTNRGASCGVADRAQADKARFQEQINLLTLNGNVEWVLNSVNTSTLTGTEGKVYQLKITWGADTSGVSNNSYYLTFVL